LRPEHAWADGVDRAGSLGADDQRHLALGEGHAAPSPDVDMVERDSLDRTVTSPMPGGGGGGRSTVNKLAVFQCPQLLGLAARTDFFRMSCMARGPRRAP
jgi:hypothetical protein